MQKPACFAKALGEPLVKAVPAAGVKRVKEEKRASSAGWRIVVAQWQRRLGLAVLFGCCDDPMLTFARS